MKVVNVTKAIEVIRLAIRGVGTAPRNELRAAIETVVEATTATYSFESGKYAKASASHSRTHDVYITQLVLRFVRDRIARGDLSVGAGQKWRLLDVGAAYGRDVLRFLREPDIDPVALENAHGFIAELRRLQRRGKLGPNAVVVADMRNMTTVASESFQCVRNQAALHHLPVVGDGLGADAAVSECRRVLARGGVFSVTVKTGDGVKLIDTGEGIGGRFFQLFTPTLLRGLLERHFLEIVHIEEFVEPRSLGDVPWLFALAIAV